MTAAETRLTIRFGDEDECEKVVFVPSVERRCGDDFHNPLVMLMAQTKPHSVTGFGFTSSCLICLTIVVVRHVLRLSCHRDSRRTQVCVSARLIAPSAGERTLYRIGGGFGGERETEMGSG